MNFIQKDFFTSNSGDIQADDNIVIDLQPLDFNDQLNDAKVDNEDQLIGENEEGGNYTGYVPPVSKWSQRRIGSLIVTLIFAVLTVLSLKTLLSNRDEYVGSNLVLASIFQIMFMGIFITSTVFYRKETKECENASYLRSEI